MSNIERKYSYLDEGVFPEIGEYGVTYLTLYSSGAGNVYDGWMWDPDRVHYSETERTFGYRNPDYPDYCWDDEVVVDLSNAQSRQESSEFAQGRITSFNTNVSSRPIVLQDIDITGLDEEEREAKATTVLFSAIPLVKDAYIQAMVEVQMKVNISPTNTNGMVRVEAFYILNDESDRTMRPNPVHTFAVSTANERHTLPWLYWNPALNHEDNNYIGVKLLCTGGTAEIGISDDPEYGDAMITLTSAGLTGDHIDSGYPVSLDIYGRSTVPSGYKLKEEDYTVLCTYSTGEVYDVSRLCTYSPIMGTKITDPSTTLTAYYHGLHASMTLLLALPESIEIIGVTDFYDDNYELKQEDYVVFAYYDTGDVMDISDDEDLTYSPAMGTIINDTTTLTATYAPEFMPGSSLSDSLIIEKHAVVDIGTNQSGYNNHLIYTLYDNGFVKITGNANNIADPQNVDTQNDWHEIVELPTNIRTDIYNQHPGSLRLKWEAEGEIGGINIQVLTSSVGYVYLTELYGFENVQLKPRVARFATNTSLSNIHINPVVINFNGQERITSDKLMFLRNITYETISGISSGVSRYVTLGENLWGYCTQMFEKCSLLENLDFCTNIDLSLCRNADKMFSQCTALRDISGIKNLNVSNIESMQYMFYADSCLESTRELSLWQPNKCSNAGDMFRDSGLKNLVGIGSVIFGAQALQHCSGSRMFMGTKLDDLIGLTQDFISSVGIIEMFSNCNLLKSLHGSENIIFGDSNNTAYSLSGTFGGTTAIEDDFSVASTWDVSDVIKFRNMWGATVLKNLSYLDNWDLSSATEINGAIPGISFDDIMECSCTPSMWSQYENLFTDSQLFTIRQIGQDNYLYVRDQAYDPSTRTVTCYPPGLYDIRGAFKIVGNDYTNPIFVNPGAIPTWYRNRITNYIVANKYIRS